MSATVGMAGVVRSELTKVLTSPTALLTAGVVVGVYALLLIAPATLYAEAVAGMRPDGTIEIFLGERTDARAALTDQLLVSSAQSALFLPIVGAVLGGLELRHGQLGAGLLAVPARGRLFAAKLVVATGFLTAVAVLTAVVTSVAMLVVVWGWDPGIVLSPSALAGQGRFVVYAVLYSLAAFGIAFAARRTFVAIVALALFTAVSLSQVLTGVSPLLDALTPLSAGRNLLLDPATASLTGSPAGALAVIAVWAVGALGCAYLVFAVRDARR